VDVYFTLVQQISMVYSSKPGTSDNLNPGECLTPREAYATVIEAADCLPANRLCARVLHNFIGATTGANN